MALMARDTFCCSQIDIGCRTHIITSHRTLKALRLSSLHQPVPCSFDDDGVAHYYSVHALLRVQGKRIKIGWLWCLLRDINGTEDSR